MTLSLAIVAFLLGGAVLVRAGAALAVSGDQIAERTGLGRMLVGMLLVAFATSLPEIATDVVATVADAPDLAIADLFGSSMANMAILAIIDLRHRGRVWPAVELGHARVAAVAMVLTSLAILGIVTPTGLVIGWVGFDTVMIAGVYVGAMIWLRRAPSPARASTPLPLPQPLPVPLDMGPAHSAGAADVRTRRIVLRFLLAAVAILAAAPAVALSLKHVSAAAGIDQTVVGSTLLAITTSLPELIVCFAALRMGAHDLAVGNLFGSNAANMSILLLLDLVYLDGPILAAVSPAQVTAGVGAILLMALAVAALVGGTVNRLRRFEPDAILLLVAYLGALVAVAVAGH